MPIIRREEEECKKEEPFVKEPCGEPVIEIKDGLIAPDEPRAYDFKKRPDRTQRHTGMIFGEEELCLLCFPCDKIDELTPGAAILLAARIDALICCFPIELEPQSCKGQPCRRVEIDAFGACRGHPVVTGGISKFGKACLDYKASNPEMGYTAGCITNLYGRNSMPYVDWNCMNEQGMVKMVQMYYHMRDAILGSANPPVVIDDYLDMQQ